MIKNIKILTHRGLEPSKPNFFSESSFEAFQNQLGRGFGIEFDANFTKDEKMIVVHDAGLSRFTGGKDTRVFTEAVDSTEAATLNFGNGRLPMIDEVLDLIRKSTAPVSALHFKGLFQTPPFIGLVTKKLQANPDLIDRLVVFDTKLETAQALKKDIPGLHIAPSVAHPYDIERYNSSVAGTLMSVEDALANRDLFDWVWLDEWDLADRDGGSKKLYTAEVFKRFKDARIKISLVTPELHGTSPGLYGGESHPDAENKEKLFARIREILDFQPNALCTDYPEEVKDLIKN